MLIAVCVLLTLGVTATIVTRAAKRRQARHRARGPIAHAFRVREFGEFDAHLEAVAREEFIRLEKELARYLAGRVGHIVVVSKAPHGIALELSDGRRLALGGISPRTVEVLNRRAPVDALRPESINRDYFSCRLVLRGLTGDPVEIYARNITLAA
ncbi:hypothetical protein ACSMXN_06895 [Jatrophihabitans sp. DSM 45814]